MSREPVKKALCPVDFSPLSDDVLGEALIFCKNYGAELVVLNVVNERMFQDLERLSGRVGLMDNIGGLAMEALQEERAEDMKKLLARHKAEEVSHTSRIAVGIPYERILEVAAEEQVDIIILGAKGHTALDRALRFGSCAEKIFRRALCRVMFVR